MMFVWTVVLNNGACVCRLTGDNSRCHEHHRQPDGRGENPVANIDNLGVARRPEVKCFDWVAHSDIAVNTHGGECEDRGEHIVVINGHDHLAQHIPKWPGPHQIVDTLERQRTGDQGVSQGEVEDVDVGGSLHFSVSAQKEEEGSQGAGKKTGFN